VSKCCPTRIRLVPCCAGTSTGKFGPILGSTTQWFPKDRPGTYVNSVDLFCGLLRLELHGTFIVGSEHKLNLVFDYVKAFVLGIKVRWLQPGHATQRVDTQLTACIEAEESMLLQLS
jgi:hypothetical protein